MVRKGAEEVMLGELGEERGVRGYEEEKKGKRRWKRKRQKRGGAERKGRERTLVQNNQELGCNWPLACPFVHLHAPLTHLLIPHCSLR